MIFKSHQVNLDPWWGPNVKPGMIVPGGGLVLPRPEFEPTRDPEPYFDGTLRSAYPTLCEWAPRREQFDTPVNRVLIDVRAERADEPDLGLYYSRWEQSISDPTALNYWTADEIEHARKVLTRLADWRGNG